METSAATATTMYSIACDIASEYGHLLFVSTGNLERGAPMRTIFSVHSSTLVCVCVCVLLVCIQRTHTHRPCMPASTLSTHTLDEGTVSVVLSFLNRKIIDYLVYPFNRMLISYLRIACRAATIGRHGHGSAVALSFFHQ